MGEEASTVRLVRCPKCENLLPELPEYSVYQCGGCGAVLRGTQTTPVSDKIPLEKSENATEKIGNVLESGSQNERNNDDFDLDSEKGRTVHKKVSNLSISSASKAEKRESYKDSDQSRRRRLDFDSDFDQSKIKVYDDNYDQERLKWDMNVPKFGILSNESEKFRYPFRSMKSTEKGFHRNASVVEKGRFGNLPYSNEGPSSSHMGTFNSFNDLPKVKDLENDRVKLLEKLDELKAQLSRSCNVTEKSKVRSNGLYRDFNRFDRYDDGFHLPPPRQLPRHQYPPLTYHEQFHGCNQDPFLCHSSCSCSQCYNISWRQLPPPLPPPLPCQLPPQLPRHHLDRARMRSSGDLEIGKGSFGQRHPRRKVKSQGVAYHPISGGAPFISCCNCSELIKIPKNLMLFDKNHHRKIKCGCCSALILIKFEDKSLVSSVSSKVNDKKSNKSAHSSRDYEHCGYNFQHDDDPRVSSSSFSEDEESQKGVDFNKSQRNDQEKSVKDESGATEMDVSLTEYLNCDVKNSVEVSKDDDQIRTKRGSESFLGGLIKKRFKDFSKLSSGTEKTRSTVFVNGQMLTDRVVKKAEKLAGTIQPGEYWYDYTAGFWGVMNQPCLGIIPPFIEEFNYPMSKNCAAGNTRVLVNGRELNQKDLDLLAGRGLPTTKNKSYIIDISGKVVDYDTGEELDGLGKLAPTVEKVKHGFGMKVPQAVSK